MTPVPYPRGGVARTKLRNAFCEEQGGCCAACGTDDPGSDHGWALDHCHDTNMVRGVLCQGCNVALGCVADSVERLEALIEYLERFAASVDLQEHRAEFEDHLADADFPGPPGMSIRTAGPPPSG